MGRKMSPPRRPFPGETAVCLPYKIHNNYIIKSVWYSICRHLGAVEKELMQIAQDIFSSV